MIEYFKELFNKPNYLWTVMDGLKLAMLLLFVSLIILAIMFLIFLIVQQIKERKYFKCEQKTNEHWCLNCDKCLFCKHFKKTKIERKKHQKGEKINE